MARVRPARRGAVCDSTESLHVSPSVSPKAVPPRFFWFYMCVRSVKRVSCDECREEFADYITQTPLSTEKQRMSHIAHARLILAAAAPGGVSLGEVWGDLWQVASAERLS